MKNKKRLTTLCLLLAAFAYAPMCAHAAMQKSKSPAKKAATPQAGRQRAAASGEENLKAELDELSKQGLPSAERVARLEAFVAAHPDSTLKTRALELLTSARAAFGDEKLRTGDALGGIELFRQAVADAPLDADQNEADKIASGKANKPDRLFTGVISQLPANLYVLGHTDAAFDLARRIEERIKDNPQRLLALAAFYFGVEQADEASRLAEAATRLAPDNATAHQALGEAYRVALRLDKAAEEYARALELDPRSSSARKNLADLRRATGKPEEALALYREHLASDPQDTGARAGVVLSLFDAGKREEAERELQTALAAQADNLPLLVGAAYWYAAHSEGARAFELAEKAVALEPRFKWVWARITFGRALLAQKRPLDAERALRLARLIGRFPTLDYELASALAAAGLYQEAAEELARTFTLKDGEIETRLAGRTPAHAQSFTELLAPERRASIFQFNGADTEANARMLKALLAFHLAVRTGGATLEAANEKEAVSAGVDFVAGDDEMRAFRQLYVASRLLQRGTAWQAVIERTDAAMSGIEAALDTPVASLAAVADEIYDLRARAIAAGTIPNIPDAPRNVLSNILRGRVEDLAGWALYNQGQTPQALVRLKRAAGVLPEGSPWWRASQWHLGAALDASGNQKDALTAYVSSYKWSPDPARHAVIEVLYQKINGSLAGLDALLNAPLVSLSDSSGAQPQRTVAQTSSSATAAVTGDAKQTAPTTPIQTATGNPPPSTAPTPAPADDKTPTTEAVPSASPTQTEDAKGNKPETAAVTESNVVRKTAEGACALSVSENTLAIKSGGGSGVVMVTLNNPGGADVLKVSAATRNWADIIILAEPRTAADAADTARYTISSISQKAGTYIVTFTSPCGKQEVAVEVK